MEEDLALLEDAREMIVTVEVLLNDAAEDDLDEPSGFSPWVVVVVMWRPWTLSLSMSLFISSRIWLSRAELLFSGLAVSPSRPYFLFLYLHTAARRQQASRRRETPPRVSTTGRYAGLGASHSGDGERWCGDRVGADLRVVVEGVVVVVVVVDGVLYSFVVVFVGLVVTAEISVVSNVVEAEGVVVASVDVVLFKRSVVVVVVVLSSSTVVDNVVFVTAAVGLVVDATDCVVNTDAAVVVF